MNQAALLLFGFCCVALFSAW